MKYLILIPFFFVMQDTVRIDTLQPVKFFFDERTTEEVAKDIDLKLDLLLKKLEIKKDTIR